MAQDTDAIMMHAPGEDGEDQAREISETPQGKLSPRTAAYRSVVQRTKR
jgi:hypothetical protein